MCWAAFLFLVISFNAKEDRPGFFWAVYIATVAFFFFVEIFLVNNLIVLNKNWAGLPPHKRLLFLFRFKTKLKMI